jgi:hypothetical protein
MNKTEPIHSPSISIQLLFNIDRSAPRSRIHLGLPEQLALTQQIEQPEFAFYQGLLEEEIHTDLAWCLAHDTHLLRLRFILPGVQPPDSWTRLESLMQRTLNSAWRRLENPLPWGASCLYLASLPAKSAKGVSLLHFPPLEQEAQEPNPDPTPYGWLWLLAEKEQRFGVERAVWARSQAMLVPEERFEKVHDYFLQPVTQGLARIELYLQKGKHHARQQQLARERLERARQLLQDNMSQALTTSDFGQLDQEQKEVGQISKYLMRFLTQVATMEVLLNSLKTNRQALHEHLERVKLDSTLYRKEEQVLERHIEQLSTDLHNARTVLDSTYAFQDIQRGVETTRLERASFMMGAAAALLAGVAIFNSFLDIWNLALEGSGLLRPPSWLRILLGFTAGVSLPLTAAWFVEKRTRRAVISVSVGVLSVAAAVLATVLVNS